MKNRILTLSIALIMIFSVCSVLFIFSASAATLPSDALPIHYVGYKHAAFVSIVAGDDQTVAQLTARGNDGVEKDMNYAAVIVVDRNGFVCGVYTGLSVPKKDVVCPAGGYIISYNFNIAGAEALILSKDIKTGDVVTLYNINPADARDLENGNYEIEDAGFTVAKPVAAEGYTRVNQQNGTFQYTAGSQLTGASFDYKIFQNNGKIYFDIIVYDSIEFKELSPENSQVGASNIRIWFDATNNDSRGLFDVFYNGSEFYIHRLVNDDNTTFEKTDFSIKCTKSADSYNLVIGMPISKVNIGTADTFAYSLTYSSPYLQDGNAYGAIHESVYTDAANAPWATSGFNYTKVKYADLKTEVIDEPSNEPSKDQSKEVPIVGDAGYIALAIIAVVSIAGAFVAKKKR